VFEFGLNAYCVGERILCLMQCVMIWSLMILSSIFPMIGISDMGGSFLVDCVLCF
jgi:hypothetical protein